MNGAEAAELFRKMADRLERNPPDEFSGVFLVVPPGDGAAIDGLAVSSNPNIPAFWSHLRGLIEVAIAELSESTGAGQRRGFR